MQPSLVLSCFVLFCFVLFCIVFVPRLTTGAYVTAPICVLILCQQEHESFLEELKPTLPLWPIFTTSPVVFAFMHARNAWESDGHQVKSRDRRAL
ncbi:hypothetical protein QBC45DRAFT_216700 [Copromyces sp. CBS 386.78]|nr:hypothetical protein QBC45DRAFT_216700 [Copromyces sp. CBS 386.78]